MWDQYLALVDSWKLIVIGILILVDLLLGIIVAVKEGTFQFSKIANFLNTTVLYMLGGYFLVGLVALVHPGLDDIVLAAFALMDVGLLGGIWVKAAKLGLPIPKVI